MKPEGRLLRMTTQRLILAVVLLAGLVSLSGCITKKVLDLRGERETRVRETTNFWSLTNVRSAHATADSEVLACVEFRDSPADAPQPYTINLSQASKISRPYVDFMPVGDGRTESTHGSEPKADMIWYLYPLQKAQKGCEKTTGESLHPISALEVEAIQIRREDPSRLPGILLSSQSGAAKEGRVVKVSFAPDDHGIKAQAELKAGSAAGSSDTSNGLLIYLPAAGSGEQVQAIGVAGAFEPGSEWINPYSLLVAPAVAADTVIITMAILFLGAAHGGGR